MAESDFDALDIRLGDRRKLQREIARRQLWPDGSPLPTPDELREHKISLQDSTNGEDIKNSAQHIVSEAEVTTTSSPAREVGLGLSLFVENWIINISWQASPAYYGQNMELGEGNLGETPKSSDSIPTLELDEEMNNYEDYSTVESAPSYLSVQDSSDDDVTPRAMGDHAVSCTIPSNERGGNLIERIR